MGYLGNRTLRAERSGDVAESAKQSQLAISEQDHRQAALDAATRTVARDRAEQSQFQADASCRTKPIGAEASSFKCEVSSSTPSPGGDPSRGRLGYIAAEPSCQTRRARQKSGWTEPIPGIGAETRARSRLGDFCHGCRTKPICPGGQMVCSAHPTSGDRHAKQSQSGARGPGIAEYTPNV
jgi:hypothetical protein